MYVSVCVSERAVYLACFPDIVYNEKEPHFNSIMKEKKNAGRWRQGGEVGEYANVAAQRDTRIDTKLKNNHGS